MTTRTVLVNGEVYARLITLAQECAEDGPADRHSDASAAYNELIQLVLLLDATLPDRPLFAAVGSDGLREVVWGVGETEEAARKDAARWIGEAYGPHGEAAGLDVHPITVAQHARIVAGQVDWNVLQAKENS